MRATINQLTKFVVVGSFAAAVHLSVLKGCVSSLSLSPLWSNGIAFSIAFLFSYTGQSRWTFNHKSHQLKNTALRYLLTQLFCSFALNQGLFSLLLAHTDLNYLPASAIVLLSVPIVTFSISKYWAFK